MTITPSQTKALKDLGIGLAVVILMYTLIALLTMKKKLVEPAYLKQEIDSLKVENAKLIEQQRKIDSVTAVYNQRIDSLNKKLDILRDKTTAIKQYYHDKVNEADKYDSNDIDDFFKNRYGL